ncbi:hypothetical protein [Candidatus Alkanophaga liquidiphilum]|nr:hypothetical protein [Candidatus Alkanophaga liquidiphilum]RLG37817.1 MAG: hypothetical protein DRN91_04410 [Candidatus Alkanophagales archaeon]
MSALDKLVGNSTHFKIMKLYYENMDLSENISEISRIINRSHITVKKAINDLESIGVLREKRIGRSRVVTINEESPYTKAVFEFFKNVKEIEEKTFLESLIKRKASFEASNK